MEDQLEVLDDDNDKVLFRKVDGKLEYHMNGTLKLSDVAELYLELPKDVRLYGPEEADGRKFTCLEAADAKRVEAFFGQFRASSGQSLFMLACKERAFQAGIGVNYELWAFQNTPIINRNLTRLAQVIAPGVRMQLSKWNRDVGARYEQWACVDTEIVSRNLIALAQATAPGVEMRPCKDRVATVTFGHQYGLWAAENTEVISRNLIALAEVAAPGVQMKPCQDRVATVTFGMQYGMWAAQNTEVINRNLIAMWQRPLAGPPADLTFELNLKVPTPDRPHTLEGCCVIF